VTVTALTALFVCLARQPPSAAMLSAIGIAGIGPASPGRVSPPRAGAVEAAGDVDVLLLDKTGYHHPVQPPSHGLLPVNGKVTKGNLAEIATASLADETPEGRSVVVLAKNASASGDTTCATWGRPSCRSRPRPGSRE
jgi:K+-transporting ATPase ATPase B chain